MRKLLFYITFLTLSGQAQEINFEQNRIVDGDSLVQKKMDLKEFDLQGKDHTWSLKGIKADNISNLTTGTVPAVRLLIAFCANKLIIMTLVCTQFQIGSIINFGHLDRRDVLEV